MSHGRFVDHYPPSPTHNPNQQRYRPSTIDLILTNGVHRSCQPWLANGCPDSDQSVVEYFVQFTLHFQTTPSIKIKFYTSELIYECQQRKIDLNQLYSLSGVNDETKCYKNLLNQLSKPETDQSHTNMQITDRLILHQKSDK